jgi:intracellular sulfur oxidation DsrE/DsrF family protein
MSKYRIKIHQVMTNKKLQKAKALESEIAQLKETIRVISTNSGSLVFLMSGGTYTTWHNLPDLLRKEVREFACNRAIERLAEAEEEFREL